MCAANDVSFIFCQHGDKCESIISWIPQSSFVRFLQSSTLEIKPYWFE